MSFDVLSRQLDVLGRRFLEASAGTGKTFAIEHLVVRLLIEKAFSLEEILVVTFTRAATRELKMRIRGSIAKAAHELKNRSPSNDYLCAVLEKGEEERKKAIRHLEDALACFDQAQIFTIHGFCYKMLQEFAFEAKMAFDLIDPDEQPSSHRQKQRIFDFFRTRFKPPLYGLSQVEAVLQKHAFEISSLAEKLEKILERKSRFPALSSLQEEHAAFETAIKSFPLFEREKVVSDLRRLSPHFKGIELDAAERQLNTLLTFVEKRGCSVGEFDLLLREKKWFPEQLQAKNQKKRTSLPDTLHYPGVFELFGKRFLPVLKKAQDPVKILARMARDCSDVISPDLSFDELLHKMAESLDNPGFCDKIRGRFRALIVDEFQDTDPLQWKIFHALFLETKPPLAALYLVGDPKQSIYRFRGADVYTYLRAAESLQERASLDTNFRANQPLVHALNTLFAQAAEGKWLPLPSKNSSLLFTPVKYQKESAVSPLADEKGAVHFFLAEVERGREKSFPPLSLERDKLFPFIAQEIEKFSTQTCAILVKDRFQAERVESFLKRCGIPAASTRGRDLFETRGFALLKELLEAQISPEKIKSVLAGPLFQMNEEALKTAKGWTRQFEEFKNRVNNKGFPCFFAEILRFVYQGKSVLERVMQIPDLYEEMRSCALMMMEEKPVASCEELLFFLEEAKNNQEKAIHSHAKGAVSILTTHMSKGLEFDIVFALSLASRHPVREELIFVRENDEERLESLDLEESSSSLYLQELDAEKMRQLYVALTRAKIRVYVPRVFDLSPPVLDKGEGAPIELFFADEKNCAQAEEGLKQLQTKASITYTLLEKPLTPPVARGVELIQLSPPEEIQLPQARRSLLSFSSLARVHEREAIFMTQGEKSAHTLPAGAETGTILHGLLEKIFKKRLFSADQQKMREQLVRQEVARTALKEWEEIVVDMINSTLALSLPCGGKSFSFSQHPALKIMQEMEFLYRHQERRIKGFADLFFEWEDKYYLVDWKSNWLGPDESAYTQADLEKAMHEHDYFLQGAIYAAAFERYVKLFDKRPFETLFGGAFYIFLRGKKAFHFFPNKELVICNT